MTNLNNVSSPYIHIEVSAPMEDASSIGTILAMVRSNEKISMAKMIAPIGAWKLDARAPAAAHPIIR